LPLGAAGMAAASCGARVRVSRVAAVEGIIIVEQGRCSESRFLSAVPASARMPHCHCAWRTDRLSLPHHESLEIDDHPACEREERGAERDASLIFLSRRFAAGFPAHQAPGPAVAFSLFNTAPGPGGTRVPCALLLDRSASSKTDPIEITVIDQYCTFPII
jgi:hypothetical protein